MKQKLSTSEVETKLLKPEQAAVTKFPKTNLDLPFFILTSDNKDVPSVIKLKKLDTQGRPFSWEVYHNTGVGIPREAAHKVQMLLTQPAINETKDGSNKPAEIIPLGGVRENLRKVGLQEGGNQGRWLIQLLDQVGSSRCVADFWVDTEQKDKEGKKVFLHIEGRFSRFAIYKIGEHHLSDDEQTKLSELKFDLDDVIYLRLDPLERKLQQVQGHRYTDNELMLSVSPPTRRWLEICGGKIYGVVKNKKVSYFDFLYSEYVLHHQPLKRHYQLKRVTEQIKRIVKDVVEQKVLAKYPEITKFKQSEKEIDFKLRFFVAEGAEESISRVLSNLRRGSKQEELSSLVSERSYNETDIGQGSELSLSEQKQTCLTALKKRQIKNPKLTEILDACTNPQHLLDQLEYVDYLISVAPPGKLRNPSGLYIHLIGEKVEVPDTFETTSKKEARLKAIAAQEQAQQEQAHQQETYQQYVTETLDGHIASLPAGEFNRLANQERDAYLTRYPHFGTWPEESLRKLFEGNVRSQLKKQIGVLTFEAFVRSGHTAGQGSNEPHLTQDGAIAAAAPLTANSQNVTATEPTLTAGEALPTATGTPDAPVFTYLDLLRETEVLRLPAPGQTAPDPVQINLFNESRAEADRPPHSDPE